MTLLYPGALDDVRFKRPVGIVVRASDEAIRDLNLARGFDRSQRVSGVIAIRREGDALVIETRYAWSIRMPIKYVWLVDCP